MSQIKSLILYAALILSSSSWALADSIPSGFQSPLQWHVGAQLVPGCVPGTNAFLDGSNFLDKKITTSTAGSLRAGFEFSPCTRQGILYPGAYQGFGLGAGSFFANSILGMPVLAFVYQGAPIIGFTDKLSLGYEWKFGAAMGWKRSDEFTDISNAPVSTNVTAMMALGLNLRYAASDRIVVSAGVEATHYSNGNTHYPNAGVNVVGASLGIAYLLQASKSAERPACAQSLIDDADRRIWMYDILTYGAWRRRVVRVGEAAEPNLCPGKFAVAGLQFSLLRRLNRMVAMGPSLDLQWDESAGLSPNWVEGSYDENIKFTRPGFCEQIKIGVSARAELIMPVFSINAGLGYDVVNPNGDKRLYQALMLKTFVHDHVYLNVGYRLGNFKDPQNLMLGIGCRLY